MAGLWRQIATVLPRYILCSPGDFIEKTGRVQDQGTTAGQAYPSNSWDGKLGSAPARASRAILAPWASDLGTSSGRPVSILWLRADQSIFWLMTSFQGRTGCGEAKNPAVAFLFPPSLDRFWRTWLADR